jgi:hypothetical protein
MAASLYQLFFQNVWLNIFQLFSRCVVEQIKVKNKIFLKKLKNQPIRMILSNFIVSGPLKLKSGPDCGLRTFPGCQ